MRRFAAEVTPALEREVAALGRHDQLVPGSENRSAADSSTNAVAIESRPDMKAFVVAQYGKDGIRAADVPEPKVGNR